MLLENQGRRWLPEDVLNLVELIDEGRNWRQVAWTLGRSESACRLVYGKVRFSARILPAFAGQWKKVHTGKSIL